MCSPASRFLSKTWRKADIFDWKICLVNNYITVKVGDRNLCRRDEVKILGGIVVHLPLFIGKLAGAVSTVLINQNGRLYLIIPLFKCLIQKEVHQTSL